MTDPKTVPPDTPPDPTFDKPDPADDPPSDSGQDSGQDSVSDDPGDTVDEVEIVHLSLTELVSAGDGPGLEPLATLLLDLAAALGMHAHVVEYSPRAGGFLVPRELAEAYAAQTAAAVDSGPVDAPAGARQKRAAVVKPAKRAVKKAAGKKEGAGDGR